MNTLRFAGQLRTPGALLPLTSFSVACEQALAFSKTPRCEESWKPHTLASWLAPFRCWLRLRVSACGLLTRIQRHRGSYRRDILNACCAHSAYTLPHCASTCSGLLRVNLLLYALVICLWERAAGGGGGGAVARA